MGEMKFSMRIGSSEISFEGASEIFDEKIQPLVGELLASPGAHIASPQTQTSPVPKAQSSSPTVQMTTKAIATKLGAKSGPDLLTAAIVSLSIVQGRDLFSRQELNDEMKTAIGFYKQTYTNNLGKYLDGLQKKGLLFEATKGNFAMSESKRADFEAALSN